MTARYFVLDIESTGLGAWMGDRITAIGIREHTGKNIIFIHQEEQEIIQSFLKWFREQSHSFDLMVTKNGTSFDLPFILARAYIHGVFRAGSVYERIKLVSFTHHDLHLITKKWISLDDMAAILNLPQKTMPSYEAVRLWKEGKLEELRQYLRHDLWLTEQVYLRRQMLAELTKKEGGIGTVGSD